MASLPQDDPTHKSAVHSENVENPDGKANAFFDENVDYSGARAKSDPREIKLVRKLDRWIMPTLWLMYWLNYLDRNAITLARLDNLEGDLNLTSSQYQTAVSILFVGYVLGQVPSSGLLPPRLVSHCDTDCLRHVNYTSQAVLVHGNIHGPMGHCQRLDCVGQ